MVPEECNLGQFRNRPPLRIENNNIFNGRVKKDSVEIKKILDKAKLKACNSKRWKCH